MAEDGSENELSGDEIIDEIGEFDLIYINWNERNELERQWRNLLGDSDDEEEFEGFEPADIYVDKTFDTWRKIENQRNIHEFEERVGPVRIFDASASALNYFQCFYTEEVFTSIVNFTNLNTTRKRDADPWHKGATRSTGIS